MFFLFVNEDKKFRTFGGKVNYKNGLICCILREGFDEFLKKEVGLEIFPTDVKQIINYIKKHFEEFNVTPPVSVIRDISDLPLIETEDEKNQPMEFWLKVFRVIYIKHHAKNIATEIPKKLNRHPDEAIKFIDDQLNELKQYTYSSSSISSIFSLSDIQEYRKNIFENRLFETPWSQFNSKLEGGFRKEELTIFAARPGVGKSMILIMMAINSLKQGFKTLFISTEMSKESIQQRSLFFHGGILNSYNQLKRNDLTHFEEKIIYEKVAQYEKEYKEKYLLLTNVNSIAVELEDIEAKILSQKPDIVYIDGVYLLRSKSIRELDKFRRVAEIFDRLKAFAKRYRCPIVVTTQ